MGVFRMKYCVVTNTTTVIDGSNNPREIMLENALNAGFSESEVEILTEEEYEERLDSEPKPIPTPTSEERIKELEEMVLFLMMNGGM